MSIEKALKPLKKQQLINMLAAVYGIYGDIDDIIERHIVASDMPGIFESGSGLQEILLGQINELKTSHEFIDFKSSYRFSCSLQSLLIDIDTLVREQNPVSALELTEAFLETCESIMNRCDDSSGDVGEVYRDAVDLWLDIAAQIRAQHADVKIDWVAKVRFYFDNNDYGCFDNIIRHGALLLSDDELTQLAWRFENDIKKALLQARSDKSERFNYNPRAAHASIGLRSVAEALEDLGMFEKATLLQSPQPNEQQMQSLIEFSLYTENYERAQHWLDQPGWSAERGLHKKLTTQLLLEQGKIAEVKENFRKDFAATPSLVNLLCYWEMADKKERKALRQTVLNIAPNNEDIGNAIEMLLLVNEEKLAATTLVTRAAEIATFHYSHVRDWLSVFKQHKDKLAAIVCYRTLLSDILDRGRSTAYHHAADYFNALLTLDKTQKTYQPLISGQAYITELQAKHWRKRSFWAAADYPNEADKPE
ncbi:DUF6880 family protein [Zhongshania sp.]|uniref:DUF6880 family protein n=1 Tax=Zhongshania sp. TaxID=1971902 RepID=UPI003567028F